MHHRFRIGCSLIAPCLLAVAVSTGCGDAKKSPAGATVEAAPVSSSLPSEAEFKSRLDAVIDFNCNNRHLNTKQHAGWQVVHGILAYGDRFQLEHNGKLVPALDYLLGGGKLKGWDLRKGDHGVIAVVEAGSKSGQGHPDQWLGYLSQCGLKADAPLTVGGESFTVRDMLTQAQWDIHEGMEATWTLMATSTYLPLDVKWTAKDGTEWTTERIVAMEKAVDYHDRACGGTHCLYGLAMALDRYHKEGGDMQQEPWKGVHEKLTGLFEKARQNQQPDGSLSTQFFDRPGTSSNIETRIHSTGHALELIAFASTDEELKQPWIGRAALAMLDMLERTQDFPLECGALYHAVHGLEIYRTRRFGNRETIATSAQ